MQLGAPEVSSDGSSSSFLRPPRSRCARSDHLYVRLRPRARRRACSAGLRLSTAAAPSLPARRRLPRPLPITASTTRVIERRPSSFSALALGFDFEGRCRLNAPQLSPTGTTWPVETGIKFRIGDQLRLAPGFRFTPEVGVRLRPPLRERQPRQRVLAGHEPHVRRGATRVRLLPRPEHLRPHRIRMAHDRGSLPFKHPMELRSTSGGALDLRLFRSFQFGFHVEWATIEAQPYAPEWVAMGLHIDLAI